MLPCSGALATKLRHERTRGKRIHTADAKFNERMALLADYDRIVGLRLQIQGRASRPGVAMQRVQVMHAVTQQVVTTHIDRTAEVTNKKLDALQTNVTQLTEMLSPVASQVSRVVGRTIATAAEKATAMAEKATTMKEKLAEKDISKVEVAVKKIEKAVDAIQANDTVARRKRFRDVELAYGEKLTVAEVSARAFCDAHPQVEFTARRNAINASLDDCKRRRTCAAP